MPGLYSHTNRATGLVLTATIYNGDHQNHIDNHIPAQMDDYSANAAGMQANTDPYPGASESLPTSLAGELERIRYILKQITGTAQWYIDPAIALSALAATYQPLDAETSKLDVAETRSASINFADNELIRPKIKDYGEVLNAIGSIGGGTQDIDLELGNTVSGTVDTSTTTFTFSNPPATGISGSFTLTLTNGGSQTVNWPASVDWAAGNAPALTASGIDSLVFYTMDAGTIWYGFVAGLDMQ